MWYFSWYCRILGFFQIEIKFIFFEDTAIDDFYLRSPSQLDFSYMQ